MLFFRLHIHTHIPISKFCSNSLYTIYGWMNDLWKKLVYIFSNLVRFLHIAMVINVTRLGNWIINPRKASTWTTMFMYRSVDMINWKCKIKISVSFCSHVRHESDEIYILYIHSSLFLRPWSNFLLIVYLSSLDAMRAFESLLKKKT